MAALLSLKESFIFLDRLSFQEKAFEAVCLEGVKRQNPEHNPDGTITSYAVWTDCNVESLTESKSLLAVSDNFKRVLLYRARDLCLLLSTTSEKRVSCMSFSCDGCQLLVGDKSGDVFLYQLTCHNSVLEISCGKRILGHFSCLTSLILIQEDRFIVTGDLDEKIRISYFPNSYSIHTFCLGHRGAVTSLLAFNAGRNLVSGGADGQICCWCTETGTLLSSSTLESSSQGIIVHFVAYPDDEQKALIFTSALKCNIVEVLGADLSRLFKLTCSGAVNRVFLHDSDSVVAIVQDEKCPLQQFSLTIEDPKAPTLSSVSTKNLLEQGERNVTDLRGKIYKSSLLMPLWHSLATEFAVIEKLSLLPQQATGVQQYLAGKTERMERLKERQRRSTKSRKKRRREPDGLDSDGTGSLDENNDDSNSDQKRQPVDADAIMDQ